MKHIVLVGDGKTYDHLVSLKAEFGDELTWMISFIGDFHILCNFQQVIMKLFWDAGLKDIAKVMTPGALSLNSLGFEFPRHTPISTASLGSFLSLPD